MIESTTRSVTALIAVLISSCLLPTFASAIEVQVSNAPENDLALTLSAINSAQKSIFLNIYELSSADIANALLAKIQAGVQVAILEEGSPVGGMSTTAKAIESSLTKAMQNRSQDHFYQMGNGAQARRYHYDHAKYAVIDQDWLLIGSENYSPTGNPAPGSLGNRGWEVLIHDPAIAQNYRSVFQTDSTLQFGDVLDLTKNPGNFLDAVQNEKISQPATFGSGFAASAVARITSPDTSLNGLVGLIQNARSTIDIEQMTFDSDWNGTAGASPLTAAVIAATKRGVRVRVLLNDERVFDHPNHPALPHNTDTITLLTRSGVNAQIANLKAMGVDYIHNKGMLIDGSITLVSSINWDQNSIEKNREAAVAIVSPQVNQYYESFFQRDWLASSARFEVFKTATKTSFDCPHSIHFTAKIGELNIGDSGDEDFKSLSNKKIEENFAIDNKMSGCILVQESEALGIEERQLIELKAKRDGTLVFVYEGYTSKSHKIFSIRKNFKTLDPSGSWAAAVYDGSGVREHLGNANITVELK